MRRDLYAEVSVRIVAELERGAAPWIKPWSATAGANTPCNAATNRPYSGCNVILLWLTRDRGWPTPRFLTFKQAIEAGGNVRKGEHGTKVYFVKQLQVADRDGEEGETRIVPMMREYTVFNVDQCEGLPDRVAEWGPEPRAEDDEPTLNNLKHLIDKRLEITRRGINEARQCLRAGREEDARVLLEKVDEDLHLLRRRVRREVDRTEGSHCGIGI